MIAVYVSAVSLAVSGASMIITGNTAALMGDRLGALLLRSVGASAIFVAVAVVYLERVSA